MNSNEIRRKFLEFFEKRGHTVVPSSSLIPDDPSVLLTTAGMQQFKPYFTGEADAQKDFGSLSTASVQKSFRTSDIDEVGDETHLTFFEMLGNFSFGGYFKRETIGFAHEFITKETGLEISHVTIFQGDKKAGVPKDEESKQIWESLGVTDVREEGMEDVFWGPTGTKGPCGPTTEVYCRNKEGKDVEIWNCVFNQFFYPGSREELLSGTANKKLEPLKIQGVDTGMGLERLAMIAQNTNNIFETDLFMPLFATLPDAFDVRKKRVITDHARASVFLLADGVRPSNKEAGYILRRLMRRVFMYEQSAGLSKDVMEELMKKIIEEYGDFYSELKKEQTAIQKAFLEEYEKFKVTLARGMQQLEGKTAISGTEAFDLYQSYGLPPEVTKEYAQFDWNEFETARGKHAAVSAVGGEKKFGGHGLILDTGEIKAKDEEELKKVTRLHTATHILHWALREVLGKEVEQRGSDITAERTRFDFSYPRKLTLEEREKVEALVNQKIKEDWEMNYREMKKSDAEKTGALHFFKLKYPETVKVYYIGKKDDFDHAFSKEFCGGPHVKHIGEVGTFKIVKEEAVSAGIRRMRATVI